MFLGISATVLLVNEDDRKQLGKLIETQRKKEFGTKSAAYKEADVNAATWDRAEAGETVREDRLQAIVRLLWPSTSGDPDAALARAGNQWATDTPIDFDEAGDGQLASWASENFERINQTLAEMADAIEALTRKVATGDGSTTKAAETQKNELEERRAQREEVSDEGDRLAPAADDVSADDDEEPGGSR